MKAIEVDVFAKSRYVIVKDAVASLIYGLLHSFHPHSAITYFRRFVLNKLPISSHYFQNELFQLTNSEVLFLGKFHQFWSNFFWMLPSVFHLLTIEIREKYFPSVIISGFVLI